MKLLPLLPFIIDYPFLKPAKILIEEGFSKAIIEDAVSSAEKKLKEILFGNIRIEAKKKPFYCEECEKNCRIFYGNCFENCSYVVSGEIYSELKVKAKISVLSHVAMVSAVSDYPLAKRKFAITLARAYRNAMERDETEVLPDILAANFGIRMIRNDSLSIHVSDYLKAAAKIKSEEWKLCNRYLRRGYVSLTLKEFYRVIEEFLRELFLKDVGIDLNGLDRLKKIAARFESKRRGYSVKGERFPPCMAKILSDLQMGENVPHTARFALTTFLLNIGYSIDEIVNLFRKAPDFDEEKTRYQVEHIAGKRGSGKEYSTPSCSTMKTYQNCVAECGVKHPLEYYKKLKN